MTELGWLGAFQHHGQRRRWREGQGKERLQLPRSGSPQAPPAASFFDCKTLVGISALLQRLQGDEEEPLTGAPGSQLPAGGRSEEGKQADVEGQPNGKKTARAEGKIRFPDGARLGGGEPYGES